MKIHIQDAKMPTFTLCGRNGKTCYGSILAITENKKDVTCLKCKSKYKEEVCIISNTHKWKDGTFQMMK